MALSSLPLELLLLGTDLHVLLTLLDRLELVADVVLAVDGARSPSLQVGWVVVVVQHPTFESLRAVRVLMVDEFLLVTEVVKRVVLASPDDLASPVPAAGDVELPLAVRHQTVVGVEWADVHRFFF